MFISANLHVVVTTICSKECEIAVLCLYLQTYTFSYGSVFISTNIHFQLQFYVYIYKQTLSFTVLCIHLQTWTHFAQWQIFAATIFSLASALCSKKYWHLRFCLRLQKCILKWHISATILYLYMQTITSQRQILPASFPSLYLQTCTLLWQLFVARHVKLWPWPSRIAQRVASWFVWLRKSRTVVSADSLAPGRTTCKTNGR